MNLIDQSNMITTSPLARDIVAFVPVSLAEAPEKKSAAAWVRDVTPDVTTNGSAAVFHLRGR